MGTFPLDLLILCSKVTDFTNCFSPQNFKKNDEVVGNKAKGGISKRVFQESKGRQNFRKTNIFYLLIRTHTYQGVRNVCFSEILACFAFLKNPF